MATWTSAEKAQLYNRIAAIESHQNDMAVAIDGFLTLAQLQELQTIYQAALDIVETQVNALESRVTAIEDEPLS